MRENRDERYSGFSGWLRKNRTALRNCGIAAAVIGTDWPSGTEPECISTGKQRKP